MITFINLKTAEIKTTFSILIDEEKVNVHKTEAQRFLLVPLSYFTLSLFIP